MSPKSDQLHFIVDHLNAAQLYKGSIPIVSPKANHIVFPNDQGDFGKELPEMTIYHRSAKGFVREFYHYFNKDSIDVEWIPIELKWFNDNEFKFIKEYKPDYSSLGSCGISQLKAEFKKGVWHVFDNELCYLSIKPEYDYDINNRQHD